MQVTKDPQEKIPIIENLEEKSENENIPFFNVDNKDIEKIENDDNDDEDEGNDK